LNKQIKDTDYLAISARIRAMENMLLTQPRMEKILDARREEEITKILQDCNYFSGQFNPSEPAEMDAALTLVRGRMFNDMLSGAPDKRYVDIFRMKYDYHNLKALLKGKALGKNVDKILMDIGRVPLTVLKEAVESEEISLLPTCLGDALLETKEVLNTTRDPQLSDVLLDRWYYQDLTVLAEEIGSPFVQGYIRTRIDSVNLRILVRTIRMGKNVEFLKGTLVDGGNVDLTTLLKIGADRGAGLAEAYHSTDLKEAAQEGASILKTGSMTQFEKLCDDGVAGYMAVAQTVSFGEEPLLAYMSAHETEFINLRILLMGRMTGLSDDLIRSRLRTMYI
jgi:V/A-type H+-transporting ATPase subunit C